MSTFAGIAMVAGAATKGVKESPILNCLKCKIKMGKVEFEKHGLTFGTPCCRHVGDAVHG
jgi:hypothetical protein